MIRLTLALCGLFAVHPTPSANCAEGNSAEVPVMAGTSGISKLGIDVGGFGHEVTIQRESAENRLRQAVSPFRFRAPFVWGQLEVHSGVMWIRNETGTVEDVWGPLNTRIRGTWSVSRALLVTLKASIPAGKRSLNAQEYELIRTVARNDFNFPVRSFGEGLDVGGAATLAKRRGHLICTLGVGYLYKGKYDPYEGVSDYQPGEEVVLSFGLDRIWRGWRLRAGGSGTYYRSDKQEGRFVFRNGKQILAQAGVGYTGHGFQVRAGVTEIVHFKNRELDEADAARLRAFVYELRKSNGNDLRAELELEWSPAGALTLALDGRAKILGANARQSGDARFQGEARLYEGGAKLAVGLTKRLWMVLKGRLTDGWAEDHGVQLSARTLQVMLSSAL